MKFWSGNVQIQAIDQYFSVVLFYVLHKVSLSFATVGEILRYDRSNGSYWAVFYCGPVYYAEQDESNCWACDEKRRYVFQMKAIEQCYPVVLFIMLNKLRRV